MNKINFYLESRLASVKKRAAEWAKRDPEGAYKSALDWQVKYGRKGWIRYDSPNAYSDSGDIHTYNLDGYDATPIQDISRRTFDYSGYYADNFQGELVKPYIVKIKTSRGLFIAPAFAYTDCDMATIFLSRGILTEKGGDIDAAAYDCARIADHIAEREAERSRDADAQFQAEREQEQLQDEIKEARQTARGLIAAIKAQRRAGVDFGGAICDVLTDKLREYRREIIKARERRDALKNDYWLAVGSY